MVCGFRIETKQAGAGEGIQNVKHSESLSDESGFVESLMGQNVSDWADCASIADFVTPPFFFGVL